MPNLLNSTRFYLLLLLRIFFALPPLFISPKDISLPLISLYMAKTLFLSLKQVFHLLANGHFWPCGLHLFFSSGAFIVSTMALFGYPTAWIGLVLLIDANTSLHMHFAADGD